jgi:hypothetical protein
MPKHFSYMFRELLKIRMERAYNENFLVKEIVV